jgi:hypothetical protein
MRGNRCFDRFADSERARFRMESGFWSLVAVIGYIYQAEELFGIARYTGIAFPTAIALFVLCLGILASCVDAGILSV